MSTSENSDDLEADHEPPDLRLREAQKLRAGSQSRRPPIRHATAVTALSALAAIALVVAGLSFDLYRSYRNLESQAYDEAASLEGVYESHVLADVRAVDQMLGIFVQRVKLHDARIPSGIRDSRYNAEALDQLEEDGRLLLQSLPAGGLTLLDPSGRVIAGTSVRRGLEAGEQDYVTEALVEGSPEQSFVGAAFVGPTSGRRLVPMSRPVYRDDGSLIGIALVTLNAASLVEPFRSMASPHASTVTIVEKKAGIVLARAPAGDDLVGRSIDAGELFRKHLPASPEGSVRISGSLAGTDLLISYRVLSTVPLVIVSALNADLVFASWQSLLAAYLLIGSSAILAILGLAWLVTRDLRRRRAVRDARRTRTIIDGMAASVVLLSTEGRIIEVNRSLLEWGKLDRVDVVGRLLWQIAWFAYSDSARRAAHGLFLQTSSGRTARRDLVARTGPDEYRTLDVTLQPVEQDAETYLIASGIDVTDQRRAEEQQRNSQKMEALGLLAGGVAHDFNNLLASMSNFAGFLVEDLDPGSPQHGFATRLCRACDQGKEVVRQIQTYARPDGVQRESIDLAALAREVWETISASAPGGIVIEFEVQNGGAAFTVLANPAQMTQILLNLCVNAIDAIDPLARSASSARSAASRSGGADDVRGVVRVSLDTSPPDPRENATFTASYRSGPLPAAPGYARLRVSDTGSGMTGEVLQRIFDPFFTTKNAGRGSGLGLAVVQSIVVSLGGAIEVETSVGEGSVFTIWLPLVEQPESRTLVSRQDDAPHAAQASRKEHLLVVDDDPDVAESLALGLERAGYEVTVAADPEEALVLIEAGPAAWPLIIADHHLPRMSGIQLIHRVKEISPTIATILHSGSVGDELPAGDNHGIDGFLRKPTDIASMKDLVRILLDGSSRRE